MAGLVEDLLMLARLDEGQPLVRDRVDLAPLVDDVVLVASSTHPSRRIRSGETDQWWPSGIKERCVK